MAFVLQALPTVAAGTPQQDTANGSRQRWAPDAGIDPIRSVPMQHPALAALARFYRKVGYLPVWTGREGLLPQGEILLKIMAEAPDAGLFAEDYPISYVEAIRTDRVFFSEAVSPATIDPVIRFDVLLTHGMLRYARHLSRGRAIPEDIAQAQFAKRRSAIGDIPTEMAQALIENRLEAYFESLHPQSLAYQGLRKALQRYEHIQHSGGWPTIAGGSTLRQGDKGPRIVSLRRHLALTQDLPDDLPTVEEVYDEGLETAVKRFQRRHGLNADGLVGSDTLIELNIPVEARIRQLQLNMERWRWFPDDFGERHLMVNIPAFELNVVEQGQRMAMRAIVGQKRRQTPILSGRMTYLEFNPYWNIPYQIARKDILPKAIGDPSYLSKQGIRVFDGWDRQARELDPSNLPWQEMATRSFPYRLRQDPSAVNALGQIKFMFPNPHSVYIHDTPAKSLFDRPTRSFSSGCVRVEAPLTLARHLLRNQGWNRKRLEAVIAKGERFTVLLDHPIAVHLVYFTAWVDADNAMVNFRQDIYGRDQRLLSALETHPSELYVYRIQDEQAHPPALASTSDTGSGATAAASAPGDSIRFEPPGVVAGNPMTGT